MKTCVFVHLSISTILNFTNGSKTLSKLGYLSLLVDLPSSSRLAPKRDPPSAKGMIFKLWHRNHHDKLPNILLKLITTTNILLMI